jgi:hypothetical protein
MKCNDVLEVQYIYTKFKVPGSGTGTLPLGCLNKGDFMDKLCILLYIVFIFTMAAVSLTARRL